MLIPIPVILPLVLIVISFIVFAFGVFYLAARYKRIMLVICSFFVVAGFALYTSGYLSLGKGLAVSLFAALRGIFSVARMLSIEHDHDLLAGVQGTQWLTESIYMQILFWLCHVAALIIVYTALISLFGRKLIDSFRLRFGTHNEVYIIKGSDKNAFLLAENIATHDAKQKKPDKKRLIVFLLDEDDDEEKIYKKTAHFDGIVLALDNNQNLEYFLKKAGLGKHRWPGKEKKYTVILMAKDESAPDDARLIAEFAKIKNVSPNNLDIFVFTSSEWDREKIEKITQAKDGDQRKYPYTFHIVSEVDLLTRQMIEKHPPFECLSFSSGKSERDFTVMILGFGNVGQSALLRLVMNGQFTGSRMRAIIVDRDIEHLREHFLHRYPSLKLCCETEFMPFDVRDADFYKLLNESRHLDYIVVSLNDDILSKQTALDIRLHYERKNSDIPFIAVSEKSGSLSQAAKQDEKLFVFGCQEDIYKESMIIREKTDRMAKAVNEVYKGHQWHELDWFFQESNRAAADFIPAVLKLAKLNEKEAIEKDALTDDSSLAEILSQTEHLRWNAFHAAMGYSPITIEEMNRRYKKYSGNGNRLDYARRDTKACLHVCLVHWDELDKVSEAYRELERLEGKEPKRDFKVDDRNIIINIPKFLRTAKSKHGKE
jgi:hypothetical protein